MLLCVVKHFVGSIQKCILLTGRKVARHQCPEEGLRDGWDGSGHVDKAHHCQHLRYCRFPLFPWTQSISLSAFRFTPEHKAHHCLHSALLLNTKHTTVCIPLYSWTQSTPLSAFRLSPEHKAYHSQHLHHCRMPLSPWTQSIPQHSAFLLSTKYTTVSILPFSWTQCTPQSASLSLPPPAFLLYKKHTTVSILTGPWTQSTPQSTSRLSPKHKAQHYQHSASPLNTEQTTDSAAFFSKFKTHDNIPLIS